LVSLAVLGLIAGLTVPKIFVSVDKAKTIASEKETIQMITQIIQEGYLSGDFANISDWSVLNPTDPIVSYFTGKMNIAMQCNKGTITGTCATVKTQYPLTHANSDHSARWLLKSGVSLSLYGDNNGINGFLGGMILMTMNSKPNDPNQARSTEILCNISDSPISIVDTKSATTPLKAGMCDAWQASSPVWDEIFSK
jgi:type II secretory pathway pseudopilin PulG